MKLITLISDILNHRPDLTHRTVIHLINLERATLLKNKLNQGMKINDNIQQTLLNVEMGIADNSELDIFPTDSRVLRSREKLPSLITLQNKHSFLRVRNPKVITERFNVKPIEDLTAVGHGRFNKRSVFVSWYDNRIYVPLLETNPKLRFITTLNVEGVFEDPLAVMAFNDPSLTGRQFWTQEYPISHADWTYIKNVILNGRPSTKTTEEEVQPVD